MLLVLMFKEQSHDFYSLFCILEITLNLTITLIFSIACGRALEKNLASLKKIEMNI